MPDFAIIPELPARYPIDGRRPVARIVSVYTVVVSQVPAVVSPATEIVLFTIAPTVSLPIARQSDQFAQDLITPPMPGVATETGASLYVSVVGLAQSSSSDSYATDLATPPVPAVVAETTSAGVRTA